MRPDNQLVQPRQSLPASAYWARFVSNVRIELQCLGEFYFFSRRHRRYVLIFILLYAKCLKAVRRPSDLLKEVVV